MSERIERSRQQSTRGIISPILHITPIIKAVGSTDSAVATNWFPNRAGELDLAAGLAESNPVELPRPGIAFAPDTNRCCRI